MEDDKYLYKPIIERRSLTFSPKNATMTFNKHTLELFGFKEGKQYVKFERGKITITESI